MTARLRKRPAAPAGAGGHGALGLGRFARGEEGTQLVELAIVLPILLVLFGAVAEFGRFFYTYETLTKATRSAARYLSTEANGAASDAAARNLAVYGNTSGTGRPLVTGLGASHVEITREGGSPSLPERVTVRIEGFVYQPLFDLGGLVGSKAVSLNVEVRPSTTMRLISTTPV
ncbi:MAG TPA: TadE family protein [Pyrinomonadaceae bacterium]|nr:TadE family protein [Pyrinomonadaceae bacterium]